MGNERLLSEAEIDRLSTIKPFEVMPEHLASFVATARAYHRLRGLVEAIGSKTVAAWAREHFDDSQFAEMEETASDWREFVVEVCRRVLAEDGGEAKQETKTGGTER